jgi:hypothetical protein
MRIIMNKKLLFFLSIFLASLASEFIYDGYGDPGNKRKVDKPLARNPEFSYDTCAHLKEWETANPQPGDWLVAKEQYDTLRLYIERCANDNQAYFAFLHIGGAVQLYSSDTNRFDLYRDWLISVLYLNTTDPVYFCACMYSIAGTYQFGKYNLPNARLAILIYLRNNPNCAGPGLDYDIQGIIDDRHHEWLIRHQAGDNSAEDTTLPSLDQIGLGFLLKNSAPSPTAPLSSIYLASFTSSPNPFTAETKLRFALNRMSYVSIEVYDLLGNKVYGNASGRTYEAGSYEIALDGKTLPHGTLYARISTGFGEVKTVKLVHER